MDVVVVVAFSAVITGGGIFQSQPTPPNSTVPSGGIFEEQQIPPSGPAIQGGGTF